MNGKKPDVYVEGLMPVQPAIIEIASTNDNSMSGEDVMDRCSQAIINYANTVEKGIGSFFYFSFAETKQNDRGRSTYRIASRALLDLVAGRITEKQFRYSIGEKADGPSFKRFLDRGFTFTDVSIEKGNLDEDDDWLIFGFGKDPAASDFE